MRKKHRILFILPSLYGHLGPSLPVAKQLIKDGHEVGYCAGTPAKNVILNAGIKNFFQRETFQEPFLNILDKSIYKFFSNVNKVYTLDVLKKYYMELIDAVEKFKPDVLYLDTSDFFSFPIAEKYNIPYAHISVTAPFYLEFDIPPFGTGWDIKKKWLNRFKLPFLGFYSAPYMLKRNYILKKAVKSIDKNWKIKEFMDVSPFLYILYSTDKLEYPRKEFIPQIFYVGPSIEKQNGSKTPDFPWEKLDSNRPLIYLATGTLFIDQYKKFFKNAVNALSEENFPFPVQVVMAVGKQEVIDELGDIPSNFIVVRYAPQIEMLKKASLFITHGGANSVNEALTYGKPMFIVHWGGDRMDVGKRIDFRKAGICIDVKDASCEKIKNSAVKILKNPEYSKEAEVIMNSFLKCDGAKTTADLIVMLADTGKPILRKKGTLLNLESIKDIPNYLA